MSLRIPPLNPLRVFEVVARVQNLTVAARELHVTQSAVSRQIALLESYLGLDLFNRERHGVTLTRAGRAYAEHIAPAFEAISAATEALTRRSSQDTLRVRTYTTFAGRWLIPRLPAFKELHPSIDVRITTAVPEVDFDRDNVDVAIQFGDGKWPRMSTDLLFPDEIEPVCTPRFMKKHNINVRRPDRLLEQRLLVSHYRRSDWDEWLVRTGLSALAANAERMTFSTSLLTWQAAVDSLGVAIGQAFLLKPELDSRVLVRPFARPVRTTGRGHYLVRARVQRESAKVRAFREWILASSAQCR